MTNEKMLEKVYGFKKMFNGDTVFDGVIAELEEDIRKELQKKKGNGKQDAILKKMMKTITRDNLKYWHPAGEQCAFLDGFRLYALNDNFGYESITEHKDAGEPFDIIRMKPKESPIKIKIDLVELQLWIKKEKAEMKSTKSCLWKPYVIETPEIKIGFNAMFLLEMLQMMNTDEINCSKPLSPAVVENDAGEWGLVLPVRLKD